MTARAVYVAVVVAGSTATIFAVVALAVHANAAGTVNETQERAWALQASSGLDPVVTGTLQRIEKADRRLLALRAYLRAGDQLSARWTWPQERLSAFPDTAEGKAAATNIDAVAAAFARANPGYTLRVNRIPRSLDLQLVRWNGDASVGTAAAALTESLERRFSGAGAKLPSVTLREALVDWTPSSAAPIAAPGLSAHGQGRAFDFQVESEGRIVAGVEVSSARQEWDAAGWSRKLHDAVGIAGHHFAGPLQRPYEPWHYWISP